MSKSQETPKIPLPKGWNKQVRSAVLHYPPSERMATRKQSLRSRLESRAAGLWSAAQSPFSVGQEQLLQVSRS